MSGRSRSYKDSLYRRLQDNTEALNYIQAALEESQDAFLVALKNVLEARNLSEIARNSDLYRGNIYRMLKEGGNPTLMSLDKILHALGLKLAVQLEQVQVPFPAEMVHVWRQPWNAASTQRQRAIVYTATHTVSRNSAAATGVCEHSISASEDLEYADVPHPAFVSECDEYEMAY